MGAVCISILILQDLLAIAVLEFIQCVNTPQGALISFSFLLLKLCLFLVVLAIFERYILRNVMARVERIHELLFILGLAWCFGVASISNQMGLFHETGAFFAGVVLARHRISFFISERLKPLRDFFLVLFFFALGCNLNLKVLMDVVVPASVLAMVFILIKPWVFTRAFLLSGEEKGFSKETGTRLGQLSEFSLLIALLAFELGQLSARASLFIQLTTILTFVVSSYIVVFKYPTPIGTSEALNRD
jgi:Kef-type K+ transport system membrane component KefB